MAREDRRAAAAPRHLPPRRVEIERGVAGPAGGPPPYVAVGRLIFDSLDALGAAWDARGGEIVADVPRYTNARPVVQVSEVVPP